MNDYYNIQGVKQGLYSLLQEIPYGLFVKLKTVLNDSIKRLDEPMQLAIIGEISSSKSTLVNAILGKREVMATGQKEVTFNVGWLKYGNPNSDIVIHHKDGSSSCKSSQEFLQWSIGNANSEYENISYIEVFDDTEILKDVNIIDTPGLASLRGADSENTKAFLQKERPDAVIMLFTHSPSKEVYDVVSEYSAEGLLNPLNAIGVLSKIDILWQETQNDQTALSIGKKQSERILRKYPMLRKCLFDIYPISALQFLASSILDESTFESLVRLSRSEDSQMMNAFYSVNDFKNPYAKLNTSVEERDSIVASIGLYGAYLLVNALRSKEVSDVFSARLLLKKESGAQEFVKILHNHFGKKAKLIKLESVYQKIRQVIKIERKDIEEKTAREQLSKIEQWISNLFSNLVHEHNEYELLYQIYNDEKNIGEDVKQEICQLFGESGFSAMERLGILSISSLQELVDKATEREMYWRRLVALEPDPEEREWMNIILTSYSRLCKKVQMAKRQYEQAKTFLFNE